MQQGSDLNPKVHQGFGLVLFKEYLAPRTGLKGLTTNRFEFGSNRFGTGSFDFSIRILFNQTRQTDRLTGRSSPGSPILIDELNESS